MMLVVDYIAFEGNGDPIFKELGVVSVDGRRAAHLLVKPPYAWTTLDSAIQKSYRRQIKEQHGICWEDGNVAYSQLAPQLNRALARAIALYSFGTEKCRALEKLTGRTFINIETEFKCPLMDHTALIGTSCLIPCHGLPLMQCALRDADRMRQWLQYWSERTKIANFCPSSQSPATPPPTDGGVRDDCVCAKPV